MTAFVGTVLPKKDSTYALTRVASKTSEKMMTTQARDDNEEDARSDERDTEESDDTYDWDDIVKQITADPSTAKVAVDGILPLHALCGAGAPIDVIKMLLEIYPEAAQAKCGKGYLPLFYHLALNTESPSEDIVAALLESYPGAAAVVDPNKQHPIHLACKATGVSEKIFTMLLRAHPDGACVCDVYGKYPVDYANANKDAATRKVALASLLSNDPEEFRKRYVVEVKEIVKKEQPMDETEETLKPAQDIAVPVARSRSNASTMSQISSKSSKFKFPTSSEANVVANEKVAKVEVKPEEKFAEVAEDEVEPEEKFAEVEAEPACAAVTEESESKHKSSIWSNVKGLFTNKMKKIMKMKKKVSV